MLQETVRAGCAERRPTMGLELWRPSKGFLRRNPIEEKDDEHYVPKTKEPAGKKVAVRSA